MKKLTKTLIAASLVCFLAGPTTVFGQFRSGKSGSSKSSLRGSSSSKSSSSRNTGGSKFSFGKTSTSKGSSTFTSRKPSTRFPSTKLPTTQVPSSRVPSSRIPTSRFPSSKLPTMNKPSLGKGTSIGVPSRFPGVLSKPTFKNPIGNGKIPSGNRPTIKVPGTSGSWLPGHQGGSGTKPSTGLSGGTRFPKPSLPSGSQSGSSAGRRPTTSVKLHHGWQNSVKNIIHHNKQHWCHSRPVKCQWWVSYCEPISHCHAHEVVVCDWNQVHCAPVVYGGVQVHEVQWYLGMKGMLLPGKGIGIEAVEPGSPAELVGLRPGMVMTVANGIALVDEASMQEAIRISGGVLQMTLLSEDGSQVLEGVVQMTRVASVSF